MKTLIPGILFLFALPVAAQSGLEPPIPAAVDIGGEDNVGTLPYSGGRTTQKAINVAPCSTEEHAGSAVANQCSSENSVTIKDNGDITCPADTNAVVLTNDANDTTKIGSNCNVSSYVSGGTTVIGSNCQVTVYNTHPNQAAPVKVGGTTVYVDPGTSRPFSTVPPPGA